MDYAHLNNILSINEELLIKKVKIKYHNLG